MAFHIGIAKEHGGYTVTYGEQTAFASDRHVKTLSKGTPEEVVTTLRGLFGINGRQASPWTVEEMETLRAKAQQLIAPPTLEELDADKA
jgi:hypothetical protein